MRKEDLERLGGPGGGNSCTARINRKAVSTPGARPLQGRRRLLAESHLVFPGKAPEVQKAPTRRCVRDGRGFARL